MEVRLDFRNEADSIKRAVEKVVRVSVAIDSLTVVIVDLEFAVRISNFGALFIATTVGSMDSD